MALHLPLLCGNHSSKKETQNSQSKSMALRCVSFLPTTLSPHKLPTFAFPNVKSPPQSLIFFSSYLSIYLPVTLIVSYLFQFNICGFWIELVVLLATYPSGYCVFASVWSEIMEIADKLSSEQQIPTVSEFSTADPAEKVGSSSRLNEDMRRPVHQWKRKNLFLDIPARSLDISQESVKIKIPVTPTPTPKRVNFLISPSTCDSRTSGSPGPSTRGRSSLKNVLQKPSIKSRNVLVSDKVADLATRMTPQEWPLFSRSVSITKIFTPRAKKAVSLPVTPNSHSNPDSVHNESLGAPVPLHSKEVRLHISRSLSVPVNIEQQPRRMDTFIRVIPSPRENGSDVTASNTSMPVNKDIPEEEAVCRICLVELREGGETFEMECSCKGELALAHKECALKWFGIKGNKTCDVCKHEVRNLPVTLLRIQSCRRPVRVYSTSQLTEIGSYRVWEEVPVLVIVSMLAHFCFLEQLLVAQMGSTAIAVCLPFSCVLGLLSSMTSSMMVKKRFVWIYATIQFALLAIFAHIFYTLVHLQAILSILLSSFAGFGAAMSMSSVVVEFLRWRRRRVVQSREHDIDMMAYPSLRPNSPRYLPWLRFPARHPTDLENPETFSDS